MEIIFSPKAGEIYSLFTSLYLGWNIHILEKHISIFGITLKKELKEEYYYINEMHNDKKEQMNFFFDNESKIFRAFMIFEKIWGSKSIEEYISFIENISEHSLKTMLVKTLIDDKLKNDDDCIEKIANNKEDILNFIKELDINKSSKWDLYCFIDNIEKYKQEFIILIKDYIPTFNKLYKKQSKFIDEINNYITKGINSTGIEFIKEYTNNFISLKDFKKIYIASSYFDSYLIYFTLRCNTENCYLVVGPYHKEIINQNDYMEKKFKNFKKIFYKKKK
ncbi:MAG TPA: hypothetical protein DCL31_12435, partial [Clostridium sp.]|nr:hypothetical protein [Clostridium sp.]